MHWVHVYMFLCTCGCELSHFSGVLFFTTLWTVAHQASVLGLSQGFPFPSPADLPDPGIKLVSLMSPIGKQVLYH